MSHPLLIYYDREGVLIRESTINDVSLWVVDPHHEMRPLEVMEVWASDHFKPDEALLASYIKSLKSYTIFYKHKIVGMFGIIPDTYLSHKALVWMLTTTEIYRMKLRFLKLSKQFIGNLKESYPFLYNWVDARNEQCVRWLRWCGADVRPAEPFGREKLPFHFFTLGGS